MAFISKKILTPVLILVLLLVASCSKDSATSSIDENLISREVSYLFVKDGSVAKLAEIVTIHNRVDVVFQTEITRFNSIELPLDLSAVRSGDFVYAAATYESGNDSLFKIDVKSTIPTIKMRTQLPFSNHNSVRFFERAGGFAVFADTAVQFEADSLKFSQGISLGSREALFTYAKGDTLLVVSSQRVQGFSSVTKSRNVSVTLPSSIEWFDIADSGSVVYLAGYETDSANIYNSKLFKINLSTGEVVETGIENIYGIDSDRKGKVFFMKKEADEGNTVVSMGLNGYYEFLQGSPIGLKATRNNVYSYTDSETLNFSVFRVDNLNRTTSVTLPNEIITFVSEK